MCCVFGDFDVYLWFGCGLGELGWCYWLYCFYGRFGCVRVGVRVCCG